MQLTNLRVDKLRNISQLSAQPMPGFNWWVGANGAGKTSILEAIYLLSSGRSFRSSQVACVITHGMPALAVYGEIQTAAGVSQSLGITRTSEGTYQAQIGGQRAKQIAALAKALPLILIHPDSSAIVTGDAAHRRQFIDAGLFHVEPSFQTCWSGYQRTLKQRNLLLKSRQSPEPGLLAAWDREFILYAEQLTAARRRYIQAFLQMLSPLVQQHLQLQAVTVDYAPGWPAAQSLEESLRRAAPEERARGFSVVGPHRADLEFQLEGAKARQILSRGQQKLFLYLLFLAQCHLYQSKLQQNPILLIDDLGSELDSENRAQILTLLAAAGCQTFLTAIDHAQTHIGALSGVMNSVFHVEQYRCKEKENTLNII